MSDEPACILVVNDDPRIRTMLNRYLTDEGFAVKEAESAASMRERMAEGRVDLVLLDIIMPGEDGFTLARELRARNDLGIIMLTGRNDLVDRVVGLEIGADDYIVKPFHLRELLARVRTVLRRARAAAVPEVAQTAQPARRVAKFEGWTLDFARRRLEQLRGEGGEPHQQRVRPARRLRGTPQPGAGPPSADGSLPRP